MAYVKRVDRELGDFLYGMPREGFLYGNWTPKKEVKALSDYSEAELLAELKRRDLLVELGVEFRITHTEMIRLNRAGLEALTRFEAKRSTEAMARALEQYVDFVESDELHAFDAVQYKAVMRFIKP